jgi:hypothetical protein
MFTLMCDFVVSPLVGNSHKSLLFDTDSTDFAAWSAAKLSDAYSEPIQRANTQENNQDGLLKLRIV